MESGGRIAEDVHRPEVTPQEEEKVVGTFSTTGSESIGAVTVSESQPAVNDSALRETVDERDDVDTSLYPTPRTSLATIQQRDGDLPGSEDSAGDMPEGNGNIMSHHRVLREGEVPLGGEENIPSRVTNIYRSTESDFEIDDGSTADQGLGEADNGPGSNGAKGEFEEVSSFVTDDTGKGTNGSTSEMVDLQITNDTRASRPVVVPVDDVKKMEDNDGNQQIAVDGNQSVEVLNNNGPSRSHDEKPEKGLSAGTISSVTIDSNFQQLSFENEKVVVPQNASVEVDSFEGLGGRSLHASGFSFERDDGKKPVDAAPKPHEGERNPVLCDDEVGKQQVKVEEEMTRSDVRPQMGNEFLQESVSGNDATQPTSSNVDIRKASKRPANTVDSSLKGPSGLGSSTPLLESAARSVQQHKVSESVPPSQPQLSEDIASGDAEEYDETREKLQMIRVKFLRLAHRLGQTPHNVVVAQVLYRLGLAEQLRGSMNTSRAGAFSFDRASAMAEQLEASGQEPLDFSCTIMVIGKTGVGKSATINSIFDEKMFKTDPFGRGTTKVQDITGTVQGIKLRIIDTPGLSPSSTNQPKNERILHAVKRFIIKTPPDVIMYLDRLDMQNRDNGDVPLLRTITNVFGPSIWFNAIVVLTHAASAPPDGPNGTPLSYEMYVTQRSHVIQQAVRQAAGDPRLLNPVSLVENHSACRMNRAGQRVLPNGQVWKPHLLLLSFASKILTEANTLLKLQESPVGRPFGLRSRAPPLPFFLSSLLQSRTQPKLPEEQFNDEDSLDETDEELESADEYDYDDLPPFKVLTKEQLNNLSKIQRKAYYEELDYREKLFYQKQLKEEKRRRNLLKKMETEAKDLPDDHKNNIEDESGGPASVPVPMPDLALPSSFDSDYPSHRYRFLDSSNQWLVRPVLETQGWDHDVGYEGLNIEKLLVIKEKIPVSLSGQLTKDKKDCSLQMDIASSLKHGEGKATSLGMDMQTVGKDLAYTFHGETQFNNFRRNSTSAGVSATILGDTAAAGIKVEDKLIVNKRLKLLVAGGAMTNRGEVACGGRVEATLRDQDYPLVRALSTLALSVVNWHGDLAIGCNLQSQIPVGRHSNVTGYANLSNRGTGQVGIRINSSEQLQLALVALIPIFRNAVKLLFGSSESI